MGVQSVVGAFKRDKNAHCMAKGRSVYTKAEELFES
jgi:hypothetical protein